jgi:hypothetical protein
LDTNSCLLMLLMATYESLLRIKDSNSDFI